ncbi:MAG TPA: hypothetical protein VMM60_01475 [Ilumatobacter sp.]|nr:hypothetical protein [Ilumatobacter sp.]
MNARTAIVQANVWLTGIFGVTAAYAAWSFTTTAQWVGAVTAMVLFAIGVFAFLWSYWNAVQRSRTEEIAVSQLYLLLGDAIPTAVRRTMLTALAFQFATATVTTLVRPEGPNGGSGSSLAVGFLVPMMGFGLNGLWAAFFGTFATRAGVRNSPRTIGQNAEHG